MTTPVVNKSHDLTINRAGTLTGWMVVPGSYRRYKANDFTGRVATGPITNSDLDTWQVSEFKDWTHGIGVEVLEAGGDTQQYAVGDGNIEAAIPKKLKLAPRWRVSDASFAANCYCDAGNYVFAGGASSIRYYDPTADTWANAVTGLGAAVVALEVYGGILYAALGDSVDMQKCIAPSSAPTTWAAVTGKKARWYKKWKKLLWMGVGATVVNFDGATTWNTIGLGDITNNALWGAVQDSALVVAKSEGLYVSTDGAAFSPILQDIPEYSGNFAQMRPSQGWLYYNIISSVQRISALTGSAILQIVTPKNIADDTYGWGIPVSVAASAKYVWVLFNNGGASGNQPWLGLYSGGNWHPAYLGTAGATAKTCYFSQVAGRLFINDGSTRARRYLSVNDEGYPDYDTTAGYAIDFLHLDASLAQIVKAWKEITFVTKNCSANKKIEIYYQADRSGTWVLAGTVTASPQQTIALDSTAGAIQAKDLQLRATFYTDSATVTPEITTIVVKYLPRPDSIYAVTMVLDISDYRPLLDGTGNDSQTIAAKLTELRAIADAKLPVTIDTMDDLEDKAFMTMVSWQDAGILESTQ